MTQVLTGRKLLRKAVTCIAGIKQKHAYHMGALSQITAVHTVERTEWPTAYFGVNIQAYDETDSDAWTKDEAEQKNSSLISKPLDLQLFDLGGKEDLAFSHWIWAPPHAVNRLFLRWWLDGYIWWCRWRSWIFCLWGNLCVWLWFILSLFCCRISAMNATYKS